MFAYLATALGEFRIINEEDSGYFFSLETSIRRPAFRVVTRNNDEFLVEMKNFHQKNLKIPFKVKSDYLSSLLSYSDAVGREIKFAIYWSPWNIWTLIPHNAFIYLMQSYTPYHRTISDLRKNNLKEIGKYFVDIVRIFSKLGYSHVGKIYTVS